MPEAVEPSTDKPQPPRDYDVEDTGAHMQAHGHLHMSRRAKAVIMPVSLATLLVGVMVAWLAPEQAPIAKILGLVVAALCGLPIVLGALKEVARLKLGLNVLVAIAIVLAVAADKALEAGVIAFILQLAILIEELAERGARNALVRLERLAPDQALVRRNGKEIGIPTGELVVGDRLILRPGDRIAADGKIALGATSTDESMISGESLPVDKRVGDDLLAGTVNLTGGVEIDVTRVGEDSALGSIIALVTKAQGYQPQIIRLADRFFAYYTPIMIVLAITVLAFNPHDINRAISLFLVGCACPILLSAPIATFMALFRASQAGVLVKAGPFIEASAAVRTVVFDKTGTLTTGKFVIRDVVGFDGVDADEVLAVAASAEQRSNHPLAKAIADEARRRELELTEPVEFAVIEGMGVHAKFGGRKKYEVAIGSAKVVQQFVAREAEDVPGEEPEEVSIPQIAADRAGAVPAYVIRDGKLIGAVLMADQLRPEAVAVCRQLRGLGIRRISLLTGDREATAAAIAEQIGANDWRAELLPGDKVDYIRELQTTGQAVAMIGDGINDAPSLTVADLGVSMGIHGADVATEASDAVLLQDDLRKVPFLIALARSARQAIFQNLIIAMSINSVAIVLAAFGLIHPILAVVIHNLGGVIVFLNGFRLASFHWDFALPKGKRRHRGPRGSAKPTLATA